MVSGGQKHRKTIPAKVYFCLVCAMVKNKKNKQTKRVSQLDKRYYSQSHKERWRTFVCVIGGESEEQERGIPITVDQLLATTLFVNTTSLHKYCTYLMQTTWLAASPAGIHCWYSYCLTSQDTEPYSPERIKKGKIAADWIVLSSWKYMLICKSSSSRFRDSKKYESEFTKCFLLKEPRTGEICNACRLLVKRYKKLPPDTPTNWIYIIDSRGGPDVRSSSKYFKSQEQEKPDEIVEMKDVYVQTEDIESSPAINDDVNDKFLNGSGSKESSRFESPKESDDIEMTESTPTEEHRIDSNDELADSLGDKLKVV